MAPGDWECILVDDGSTDMGPQLCDTFAAEIPGVRVIHRENGGLAAARNTGLGAARGEWILFLDSDDAMAPGLLAALRRALTEHPGYDWYVGKHLEWQPDGSLTEHAGLRLLPGPFDSSDYGERLRALYTAGHWSVWKCCLRRAWLAEHNLHFWPDVRWAEDWPFDLWLLTKCQGIYFLDIVFTHYRVGRQGSPAHRRQKPAQAVQGAGRRPAASGGAGRRRPHRQRHLRRHAGCRGGCLLAPGPHRRRARRRHPQKMPQVPAAAAAPLRPRHRGEHPPGLADVPNH